MIRSIFISLSICFSLSFSELSFATYPSYYSHFYKGLVVLAGQSDTIRGYILLEPSIYKDSIPLPFDKYYNYNGSILFVKDTLVKNAEPLIINKDQISFVRLYYNVLYPSTTDTTQVWSLNYGFGVRSSKERQQIIKSGKTIECYTDFKSFTFKNKRLLLRMLNFEKVAIYDDFLNPEKCITEGYQLIYFLTPVYSSLFTRNRIFVVDQNRIEEIPSHFSFHSQRQGFILKFINKRYKTQFKKNNFADNRQMFEYISEHG